MALAEKDDLRIPDFLRRKPGEKAATTTDETTVVEFIEPWQRALEALEPEKFREYIREKIQQGRFERRWLVVKEPYHTQKCVDLTIEAFRNKFDEIAAKAEKRAEDMRDRVRVMREASPTFGLIPLRKILQEMGPDAKRRGHAKAAIDAAGIEHVRYHWHDSPVTLARVKQAIRDYVPPVRARGRSEKPSFPEDAKIDFRGKNPKQEGSDAYSRWKLLMDHSGKTVGEFAKARGNLTTLRNAIAKGHVKLVGGTEPKKEKKESCPEPESTPKKSSKKSSAPRSRSRSRMGSSRRERFSRGRS